MPTLIELENFAELEKEVFGPVLHVVRYNRNQLAELIEQINASGYGLTLGVHTRIDETIAQVTGSAHVGNLYVNRNMVGAVVASSRLAAKACPAPGQKREGRSISTACWHTPAQCAQYDADSSGCALPGGCAA